MTALVKTHENLTVCEIFFKLKFSRVIHDIRTQESFGQFLLIVYNKSSSRARLYNGK